MLPRINLKREAWPGGPQVGEVIQAQLEPRPSVSSVSLPTSSTDQTSSHDSVAVELLLLLR